MTHICVTLLQWIDDDDSGQWHLPSGSHAGDHLSLYTPGQKFTELFLSKMLNPRKVKLFGMSCIRNEAKLPIFSFMKFHIYGFSGNSSAPQNNEQPIKFPMST